MNNILLTKDVLNVGKISDIVSSETCGAISLFVGVTRNNFNGKKVLFLEYEAYESMAKKQMDLICSEVRSTWKDVTNIAIHHRLGSVPISEASVVIAISSPHRQSSLEAVSFVIDELKRRVPIWKKEQYEDDNAQWKQNLECPWIKKGSVFNFDSCAVQTEEDSVTNKLVQIQVEDNEMQRRVNCFVEKKRNEINTINGDNFMDGIESITNIKNIESDKATCARTHSFLGAQKNSSGQLRVKRVNNKFGPQIRPNYSCELEKMMTFYSKNSTNNVPASDSKHADLKNRLGTIEQYIGELSTPENNIYVRIKKLENKIMHLESLSPEYMRLMKVKKGIANIDNTGYHAKKRFKNRYTIHDLDNMLSKSDQNNLFKV